MPGAKAFTETLVPLLVFLLLTPVGLQALEEAQVVVVANRRVAESVDLARYYMKRRAIPPGNLISVETATGETISREDYRREIQQPVLLALTELPPARDVRCLVLMYGMPLKIRPPALSDNDESAVQRLRNTLSTLRDYLEELTDPGEREQIEEAIRGAREEVDARRGIHARASLDAEIALIFQGGYPLEGWLPNPWFVGFQGGAAVLAKSSVLMVSRLDGPDPATVCRTIDSSLNAEATGLAGRAYFDARWPRPQQKDLSGYALYDNAIHRAAELVRESGRLEVVLDSRPELFQEGDCPNAVLYCGWYSLARYVDAFDWRPGAIGFHIASSECATLKRAGSQVWCKRMLEDGVAATVGPVNEPYVQGFPLPDVFFGKLIEGRLCLAECYLVSLPYLSWQMVLIGDPLYRPFAATVRSGR